MKVAVYEGARVVRLQERPELKAAPGEVIVKVKCCGICGTDIHIYLEGERNIGLVLGHEVAGTVAEIGRGVEGWKIGERVVIGPPGPCGECYYCRRGRSNKCVHAMERTVGLSPGCDGGMAEYVRVRYPRNMLIRIPDEVSFEDAVLVDTITVSLRGIRQSRFRLGDSVVVAGAGPIGYSAIQFLRIGGARHITVLEPSEKKRELALKCGADVALNPLEEGDALQGKVMALYGGIGADVAFECAGTPQALQSLLGLVKCGGQVLLIGQSRKEMPISSSPFVSREIEMKGSHVYDDEDIRICLDFLAKRRFNTEGMVADIISLDDIVEKGFERLATNKNLMKVVIAP